MPNAGCFFGFINFYKRFITSHLFVRNKFETSKKQSFRFSRWLKSEVPAKTFGVVSLFGFSYLVDSGDLPPLLKPFGYSI
jgi:hypothetical protein